MNTLLKDESSSSINEPDVVISEPLGHKYITKLISIEPIVAMVFFAASLSGSVVTNLLVERSCVYYLNCSDSNCSGQIDSKLESEAQPYAADLLMAKSVIEGIVPACFSLFIGPWSDSNGRKPFLLLSVAGVSLSYVLWGLLATIPDLPPPYFLLASIPVAFSGGNIAFFQAVLCYISDMSTVEGRAFRMGVFQSTLMGGLLAGLLSSSPIFLSAGRFGYIAIFGGASALAVVALIYSYFWLPESVNTASMVAKKSFFDVSHVTETLAVCWKERPAYGRLNIFLSMASLCSLVFIWEGENTINYLETRARFSWTLMDFNSYSAFVTLVIMVMSVCGVWLISSRLCLPDVPVCLVLSATKVGRCVLMAVAPSGAYFYMAACLGALDSIQGPLIRSHISKLAPSHDLGKVFALLASLECMTPITASPIYTMLHNATLASLPGTVYWLSASLASGSGLLLAIITIVQYINPTVNYHDLQVDPVGTCHYD